MTGHEESYAWETREAAIKFAFELASIRTQAHGDHDLREMNEGVARRLVPLLNLLEEQSPVLFATLWKHKRRGGVISAVARSMSYTPDPTLDPTEYVCRTDGTHAGLIVSDHEPIPNCERLLWLRKWDCDNLSALFEDPHWNTADRISKGCNKNGRCKPLKRQVALTLGDFCKTRPSNDIKSGPAQAQFGVDFILNIYLDEDRVQAYEARNGPFHFDDGGAKDFIKAIASKMASGICALIEIRRNRITEQMTGISSEPETLATALTKAVSRVLPNQILCKDVFLFLENPDGSLKQETHIQSGPNPPVKLPATDRSDLQAIIAAAYSDQCKDLRTSYDDIALVGSDLISKHVSHGKIVANARQLLVAQLRNEEDESPLGYLVLVDRMNDLAQSQEENPSNISDFFDWEDELYLKHIADILDFIAGLYRSRERSIQRAMVLGHEILAPTRFIYESALRQHEITEGRRDMPQRMRAKEIEDIMVTSEYVETLVESLTFLQPSVNIPPANRYFPEDINLYRIASDMRRICIPLARKNNVRSERIMIGSFNVDLYMDERAMSQVLLNLFVNAIKYHQPFNTDEFRATVEVEELSVKALAATSELCTALPEFHDNLLSWQSERGILITVSDYGIGVAGSRPQRIFEPGYRETAHIRAGVFGAGIGLSVVRNILRDHRADIWLEHTDNPTQFCIFLPEHLRQEDYTLEQFWLGKSRK